MLGEGVMRLSWSTYRALEREAEAEDVSLEPEKCNRCRTPVFEGETVPGHGWCSL